MSSGESDKKYSIPFMGPYAEMFEKSDIISQLVPRKINSGKELQASFP